MQVVEYLEFTDREEKLTLILISYHGLSLFLHFLVEVAISIIPIYRLGKDLTRLSELSKVTKGGSVSFVY